jgi:hypothetical protein
MDLKEGECWYMNFNLPHSVNNKSQSPRIHLVIDAKVNDWVKELFSQPATNKKEMDEPGYDEQTKQQIIAGLRAMNTDTATRLADEMSAGSAERQGANNKSLPYIATRMIKKQQLLKGHCIQDIFFLNHIPDLLYPHRQYHHITIYWPDRFSSENIFLLCF